MLASQSVTVVNTQPQRATEACQIPAASLCLFKFVLVFKTARTRRRDCHMTHAHMTAKYDLTDLNLDTRPINGKNHKQMITGRLGVSFAERLLR